MLHKVSGATGGRRYDLQFLLEVVVVVSRLCNVMHLEDLLAASKSLRVRHYPKPQAQRGPKLS